MSDAKIWFYECDGERLGPVASVELKALAANQTISSETLVWKQGLSDWIPASRINGLFAQAALPPPLPVKAQAPTATDALKTQFSDLRKQFEGVFRPPNQPSTQDEPSIGDPNAGVNAPFNLETLDRKKLIPVGIGCGSLLVLVMCCGVLGSMFGEPSKPSIRQLQAKDPEDLTYSEKKRLEDFSKDVNMKVFEQMAKEAFDE